MNIEEEQVISCPYCGESIHVMIDCSSGEQEYIEDCQVCCRPIIFQVSYGADNSIRLSVHHENE
ncbi:MAG: CPXCG motif-containing cysteine-rich protein [Gammaproteobacteria bacterium]|nr:CPXCG motif-containing cysteine-rich protein [Gammaproteobacteria bacterium]